jgi:hypothetical protein
MEFLFLLKLSLLNVTLISKKSALRVVCCKHLIHNIKTWHCTATQSLPPSLRYCYMRKEKLAQKGNVYFQVKVDDWPCKILKKVLFIIFPEGFIISQKSTKHSVIYSPLWNWRVKFLFSSQCVWSASLFNCLLSLF